MDPFVLKWVHIISSTLLFGAALGSSLHCWAAHRSQEVRVAATVFRTVVLIDIWVVFTTGFIQPASGLLLVQQKGYSFWEPWLITTYALYAAVTVMWIVVAVLQIRCRDMARAAASWEALPAKYHDQMRRWFQLVVPSFLIALIIFWLMVFKPDLW